ncbi:hypothetical protein J6590_037913 [Homalodisca vitripennis]|nr:hypothetical protein J6590_037913 [Homalodisca vitripennis]
MFCAPRLIPRFNATARGMTMRGHRRGVARTEQLCTTGNTARSDRRRGGVTWNPTNKSADSARY